MLSSLSRYSSVLIVLEVCLHHPIPCPCAVTMIRVLVVPIRKMMMKLDKRRLPGVLCMMLTVISLLTFVENPVSMPREEMQMEKRVGNKETHGSKGE
jgi:hypothetical protein